VELDEQPYVFGFYLKGGSAEDRSSRTILLIMLERLLDRGTKIVVSTCAGHEGK
jgi:hypothetical protein